MKLSKITSLNFNWSKQKWINIGIIILIIIVLSIIYHQYCNYMNIEPFWSSKEDFNVKLNFNNDEGEIIECPNLGTNSKCLKIKSNKQYNQKIDLNKDYDSYQLEFLINTKDYNLIIDDTNYLFNCEKDKIINNVQWYKCLYQFTTKNKTINLQLINNSNIDLITTDWELYNSFSNSIFYPKTLIDNTKSLIYQFNDNVNQSNLLIDRSNHNNNFSNNQGTNTSNNYSITGTGDYTYIFGLSKIENSKLFSIDGNQKTTFEININGNILNIIVADQTYQITIENPSLLIISKHNDNLNIYSNNKLIKKINLTNYNLYPSTKTKPYLNTKLVKLFIFLNNNFEETDLIDLYKFSLIVINNLYFPDLFKNKSTNLKPKQNDISNNDNSKNQPSPNPEHEQSVQNIPTVYFNINKNMYYMYVQKDTIWSKMINNRYGEIPLDQTLKNSYSIWINNFPSMPVNKLLDPNNPNETVDKSPFKILNNNPAYNKNCKDIDWTKSLLEQPLNMKCRNAIDNHCKQYTEEEPFCQVYLPKNQNDPFSKRFREYLSGKEVVSPELNPNYIEKDKIPCYGCI